ncbi:phage baseplate protein [Yersinia enterocolitica]|uniref:phage baseplate protein n=1 Tax=Yersinia enterocolitica TaxID=630 RepID=UPI0005E60DF4|nr:phage baseplate protein [Yersinia enterocolitica]UXD30498.1 Phage protein [Yersinia enterocolitica]UYJ75314.1 phage baseplate protein [Yersinia enterocolitica]CFQ73952.1 bacteriophage (baseplate assembly) protein [Yersinia enterocolitica]
MNNPYSQSQNQSNDSDAFASSFNKLLNSNYFIRLATVTAVRGTAPNLVVDVLPLVAEVRSSDRTIIQGSQIYNIPVWRLQRGGSAIIMDPVAGDIGLIAVSDVDISVARSARKESVPGSLRTHSQSDAIYFGGVLNGQPTQFIEFADSELNITSPNPVNITCSKANITAPDGVEMQTPLLHVSGNITADGNITDNAGTQAASLKDLRDKYNSHDHDVVNVQGGSSTITSNATDNQV